MLNKNSDRDEVTEMMCARVLVKFTTGTPVVLPQLCYHRYPQCVSVIILRYYMTSSVSGQDEPNTALWLVTRAGKMALSCPLGTSFVPQRKITATATSVINPFLTNFSSFKMAGYWLRCFACLWASNPSRSINMRKNNLANILTLRLVNNQYIT